MGKAAWSVGNPSGRLPRTLRGLGTQVAWILRPAGGHSGGERTRGGPSARATERRLPSRRRALCASPPNRACSRHPSLRSGHAPHACGVRLSRRSVGWQASGRRRMAKMVRVPMLSRLPMSGRRSHHLDGRLVCDAVEHPAKPDIRPAARVGVRPIILLRHTQDRRTS
jgi:hypothetical protein